MRISCLPVSLFPQLIGGSLSLADWAAEARRIGLDGIDISMAMIRNHTPVYLRELKKNITIPMIMATAYPDFTHPDPVQRRRELHYFQADTALCAQLGIRYLRVLAGQAHTETARIDGIRRALENIRHANLTAKEYGITLLYENHSKPSAWEYTDFSYPIDIFMEILDGLRDTDVRLNFDIGNVVALGLDPLELLPRVMDRIETIHVSDMEKSGTFAPVAIGTGAVPIRRIFSHLKNNGFKNWLCIEEASNRGFPGIAQAAAWVREAWEKA